MLITIAVFAAIVTVLLPILSTSILKSRMKSVATEREAIRSRERARLAAENDRRNSLRHQQKQGIRDFVERLDLKKALADDKTIAALRTAGFRGQNPLNIFLFMRFVLPFGAMTLAGFYIFVLGSMPEHSFFVRLLVCIIAGYIGFYAPNLYVSNKAAKRKQSIRRAWPDALDLMLICVESGMSVEAAFRKVADEIGIQSVELAEELMLTNAELSFLPERRQAYDNLAMRTGVDQVKSVSQALIQAERYGTPVSQALRTLSQESRDLRMLEAEKKAAALPPKLTVPMIVFFLPVLFIVILGPAFIQLSAQGGFFGGH
jgi:tight adherence protein C